MTAAYRLRKQLDIFAFVPQVRTMAKRKKSPTEPAPPQTVEMRRPEALRWLILLAVVVMVVMTAGLGARGGASAPFVLVISFLFALALIWFGWSLFNTRARRVIFDGERVYDDSGVEICRIEDIENVERGLSMFKPSSGFSLLLKTPRPRAWSPGLWWRIGKRVGVGGATPGRAGKNLADAIQGAMTARAVAEITKSDKNGDS